MVQMASICTMSLGRCFAGHNMAQKLDQARKYNFQGVEVFYEDLLDMTKDMLGGGTPANQLVAAANLRQMCDVRHMRIIALQPFMHYEGLLDREKHRQRIVDMHLWLRLAHLLGTDLILLPSSNLPSAEMTEDTNLIVKDMQEVTDLGLHETPRVRFAFEALCWGTRIDTWQQSWDVVQRVDRPNFGLCLDTFNIAGRIYADPSAPTGKTEDCDAAITRSMETLLASVELEKVFLLQIADGERLARPLDKQHPFYNAEQPARMSWSRNARLFYGEAHYGGYLPVKTILDVIVNKMGFQGWLSFEVFNRRLAETDASVPGEMARRAAESWERMRADLALDVPRTWPWSDGLRQARL